MGIQINGNTNNINAGIGSLSIEDIRELDITGVATASNFKTGVSNLHDVGLTLSGGQLDVGSNIKLGNAGVITATSFVGSGANLTGITQTTINNNADNRIITGSGTANTLEGEANLTFDGHDLDITRSNSSMRLTVSNNIPKINFNANSVSDAARITIEGSGGGGLMKLATKPSGGSLTDRLTIASDGNTHINTTDNGNASAKLNVENSSSVGAEVLKIMNKPSGANGKAKLVFHTETSTGQGCQPYIQSLSGADAGPNATNNHNAGGFEFHTRSGGAGTDNNALRIRDDGSFEKYGANGNILLTNTGSDIEFSRGGRNRFSATHSNGYFDFHTGGQYTFPAMRLFASPNASSGAKVGINTDSISVDAQMSVMAPAGMPGLYTSYGMRIMSHPDPTTKRISNASGIYSFSASIPANNTWTTVAIGRYHAATLTMRVGDASSKRSIFINYDLTAPNYGVAHLNVIANNGAWNTGGADVQLTGSGSSDYAIQVKHTSYYNTNNNSGVYMIFNVA